MADSHIHVFTGGNMYALEQELLRWKSAFQEKHGPENLIEMVAAEFSLSSLLDAVATMPFLGEKRLVIMKGVPRMDKEAFQSIRDSIHPAVLLVFVEPELDARLTITKALQKVATMHRFEPLDTPALKQWLLSEAQRRNRDFHSQALDHLLLCVGSDQHTLLTELQKLCLFTEEVITQEDVDALCVPSGAHVIWKFTDLVGKRDVEKAVAFVRSSVERGEDPYAFWSILLNMIKNLVLVWAAVQDGMQNEKEIAREAGIHFFAVRSLKPLALSLSEDAVCTLVQFAVESDVALKSGGYKYTGERPEELLTLLDRAVLLSKTA